MKKFSLLIVATIAMMGDAQGQIPHPNAAGQAFAYSMGPTPLKEGETLVHTANGCGYILSHFLSRQTFGDKTQVQIDQWGQNHVWTGECVSGLAIGPGDNLNKSTGTKEVSEFMIYGRPVGQVTYPSRKDGSVPSEFIWGDVLYWRLTLNGPLEPPTDLNGPMWMITKTVQGVVQDGFALGTDSFVLCGGNSKGCLMEYDETNPAKAAYACEADCAQVWQDKAGLLVAEADSFINQHRADFAALQSKVDPIVASARAKRLSGAAQPQ